MRKHMIIFLFILWVNNSIFNFGHPVTPQFINDINAPIYMTGVLFGVMAMAQFIFAPLWGQISDKFGRKIIFIGPLGYAIGQLGFVFFSDPIVLIIFRFISGMFAVSMMTINFAYISDKAALEDKAKFLAIAAILIPLGTFAGYSIGGYLGGIIQPRGAFLVQAILSFILGVVLYFFIDDRIERKSESKIKWNIVKENIAILKRNNDTGLKYILAITFLNVVAYQLTFSQAGVILFNAFGKSTSYIGIFIATFNLIAGVSSFIFQTRLLRAQQTQLKTLPYLSLFSLFSSLLAFSVVWLSPVLMWIGLMFNAALNTMFIALIQDIITKIDKYNEKGALIGVNQAFQSLGMFFGAIFAGGLISSYVFAPLLGGAIIFLLTFIVNKFLVSKQLNYYISNKS